MFAGVNGSLLTCCITVRAPMQHACRILRVEGARSIQCHGTRRFAPPAFTLNNRIQALKDRTQALREACSHLAAVREGCLYAACAC